MKHFQVNDNLCYVDDPHVAQNVYLTMPVEDRPLPLYEDIADKLPIPVWAGRRDVIDCYHKTWRIAWGNLRRPDPAAGFVSNFIDTAFNGYLFMWDSSFIVMFGKYASRYFNFQATLDNFYSHQHRDGFICREICERERGEMWTRDDPSSTGPNILPWAEWTYYESTGDRERLSRVFDPLLAYHHWLRLNRSWPDGTYWYNGLSCGMDNAPRPDPHYHTVLSHGFMSWVDACAHQYLSGQILCEMARVLGREAEVADLQAETEMLSRVINDKMWDDATAFYYDTRRDGSLSGVKTLASYWTLLAGLPSPERAARFVSHLDNEREFKRPFRIPTLSADHPAYRPTGDYWQGSVWAPTNYMTLCGLHRYSYDRLAHEIARDYVNAVVEVFEKTGTVFENYAPEAMAPGNPAKPDFVGWTGLAPISILFEYVFGIHPDARNHTIEWHIHLAEEHGVRQYPLGEATVDLVCHARADGEPPRVTLRADRPVTLEVVWNGKRTVYADVTELS